MNDREPSAVRDSTRDVRQIPLWARRYAQNRTLPAIGLLLLFGVAFGLIAGLSALAGYLWSIDSRPGAVALMILLAALLTLALWARFAHAGAINHWLTERIYSREGVASMTAPEKARRGAWSWMWLPYLIAVQAHIILGMAGYLPPWTMQPVSVAYFVPFSVLIWWQSRAASSPFMLLWPALYTAHAALLLTGAPIYFGAPFESLNMLVPVFGYGMVAALAGHLYSRLALRRLRALAQSGDNGADG